MKQPRRLEANEAQLEALRRRIQEHRLEPGDYELLGVVVETVCFLSHQVLEKTTSIQRLLRMIFGARTEKTATVLNQTSSNQPSGGTEGGAAKGKRPGHGRHAAASYRGLQPVRVWKAGLA